MVIVFGNFYQYKKTELTPSPSSSSSPTTQHRTSHPHLACDERDALVVTLQLAWRAATAEVGLCASLTAGKAAISRIQL